MENQKSAIEMTLSYLKDTEISINSFIYKLRTKIIKFYDDTYIVSETRASVFGVTRISHSQFAIRA